MLLQIEGCTGYRVSVGENEKISGRDGGNGCACTYAIDLYT